ncbi:MAG TPA: prepilin-type N-terminal cleavage/methylation domain-containing protein [Gemmatimonadaceae bacterium]|nr:prepilin-type N-terminal cleavage/methylation domain-containing protein [Gemmatimonadaceae bacterium]
MKQTREGFSLIEIMVALTILSLVLVSLARLATIVAIRGRDNDTYAKRSAALLQEANKFGSMPFASLANFPTSDKSFTSGDFSYTRKLTITNVNAQRYTIKIVVAPTNTAIAKDSVIIDRTAPATSSVLCKGC